MAVNDGYLGADLEGLLAGQGELIQDILRLNP